MADLFLGFSWPGENFLSASSWSSEHTHLTHFTPYLKADIQTCIHPENVRRKCWAGYEGRTWSVGGITGVHVSHGRSTADMGRKWEGVFEFIKSTHSQIDVRNKTRWDALLLENNQLYHTNLSLIIFLEQHDLECFIAYRIITAWWSFCMKKCPWKKKILVQYKSCK